MNRRDSGFLLKYLHGYREINDNLLKFRSICKLNLLGINPYHIKVSRSWRYQGRYWNIAIDINIYLGRQKVEVGSKIL